MTSINFKSYYQSGVQVELMHFILQARKEIELWSWKEVYETAMDLYHRPGKKGSFWFGEYGLTEMVLEKL